MILKVTKSCLIATILLYLAACGVSGPTWQEKYDLGVRYLSEGNYEEAIIAFTAAIEIDPKQASAYVGRGDAYMVSGETEENLATAQADYEQAIELDPTCISAYLGLAEIYILKGKYEEAHDILQKGLDVIGDVSLSDKLKEVNLLLDRFKDNTYIDFTDITTAAQDFMLKIIDEVLQENQQKIYQLLTSEYRHLVENNVLPSALRTQMAEYKVSLHTATDYDTSQPIGEIELREENGAAALYSAMIVKGALVHTQILGTSVNWNWNGHFEKNSNFYGYSDGLESTQYIRMSMSGNCIDGLLDGDITTYFPDGELESRVETYASGKPMGRNDLAEDLVITIDRGSSVEYYEEFKLW